MLETMEKTKKRYWREELANCLGHIFNPEMLPDHLREEHFAEHVAKQAIERIRGSERLASGDLESTAGNPRCKSTWILERAGL